MYFPSLSGRNEPTGVVYTPCRAAVQAKEVLGKIRTWEGTARAGERLALEAAGAATQRAETLRDAVEFLMAGMETQNARMECLAMVSGGSGQRNQPVCRWSCRWSCTYEV